MTTNVAELIQEQYPKMPYAEVLKLAALVAAKAEEFDREWFPLHLMQEFYTVKLVVMSMERLTGDDCDKLVGMFSYACKAAWHYLENIPHYEVNVSAERDDYVITEIVFYCDSTKTNSDDPDYSETDRLFHEYIEDGTPAYKTNREGKIGDKRIQPLTEHVDVLVLVK